MQVRHGFAGVRAVVDDQTEALGELKLRRDPSGHEQQMPEHRLVLSPGFGDAGDGLFGDDQQMNRGLGLDVVKHDAMFVLVLDLRGDVSIDDFLENGFHGGSGN